MAIKITRHSDELNGRATFVLNGTHDGDEQVLIDLFRSDVPLDRETRDAIVEALQRKQGIRLELHRGNEASFDSLTKTQYNRQQIADEFERLMAEYDAAGIPKRRRKQQAYSEIIRLGLAGSDRAIDQAREETRNSIVRIGIRKRD